jgi:S-layer homology domain
MFREIFRLVINLLSLCFIIMIFVFLNFNSTSLGQVTSVSNFLDVQPTDSQFLYLQSLVERYGCIAGYSDKTFRGRRAITRFELVDQVSACIDRHLELAETAQAGIATPEDIKVLQKIHSELAMELNSLKSRLEN